MYYPILIILAIVAVVCNSYTLNNINNNIFRSNTALFSRHGVKRYHELGVKIARISNEEDKSRWEESKKKWEE